jgi:hypothetical protein
MSSDEISEMLEAINERPTTVDEHIRRTRLLRRLYDLSRVRHGADDIRVIRVGFVLKRATRELAAAKHREVPE